MHYVTVEYSANGNNFHVSSVGDILKMNRYNALRKQTNDYQLIALCETVEQANEFVAHFKQLQQQF